MKRISRARRFAIALMSVGVAAALFRAPMASALVTRGDDLAHSGDPSRALGYYRRALALDPGSRAAGDRLAFQLALSAAAADQRAAVRIAGDVLRLTANDADLLADRALAEQRLYDWPAAQRDFQRAAELTHDARYAHFAGRIATRRRRFAEARRFFRLALHDDPGFTPARAALAALQTR